VIVPGAFGEANKELDPLVHRLARLTAKTPLNRCLPQKPVVVILGVQFAIAKAEMKVMRSHLVGKTTEEAMIHHFATAFFPN
jgi:hypothetical protein